MHARKLSRHLPGMLPPMLGGDLFQRFFLRFLLGVLGAFVVFLPLVHIFQIRVVDAELEEDLRHEARWAALHSGPEVAEALAEAWGKTHGSVRLVLYDEGGELLADSQPERPRLDLEVLRRGEGGWGHLTAIEATRGGGWVVMSRPRTPAFPSGLQWELVGAALLLVALVAGSLRPLVRALSSTLGRLGEMAEQVAAGHFGRTLEIERDDELGALVHAFNDMSTKLAEAEKLETRLLHDVSHELRSPLGRIRVMAESLARRPETAQERVADIEQEVALLDRLVGELVETARIEADRAGARLETLSLASWAAETLGRFGDEVRSRGIAWAARGPGEDLLVQVDSQRLTQALGNLVDNAIHALEGGEQGRIEVVVAAQQGGWSIHVEDNGPGIPEADLPHVFRRFYRVETHRSRERGGVGLGLSLVRAITEAHGGEATISSRTGEGTRVTLRFSGA